MRTLPLLHFLSLQVGTCFCSSPPHLWFFVYVLSVYVYSPQVVWGLDQVKLLNPPEHPVPDHLLKVLFSCDEPASAQLDCLVTFDTGLASTYTLKRWRCLPGDPNIQILELKLPDWLVYRADGIVSASQEVLSCILLASIRHSGSEESIAAKDAASLQPQPYFDRPVKEHRLCFSWSARMLRLTQRFSIKLCPLEKGKSREVCAQCAVEGLKNKKDIKNCFKPPNLPPRNSAFAAIGICFNRRKLWNHKDAGALQQPLPGAHACKSCHFSMVKPAGRAGACVFGI